MSFQIIGEPPEVTQKRDSVQALAKGLGNFINHTHAQNRLQKILGTPDYQKAELPEKQRMLTEYADRFGEAGNRVLQTQLEYEKNQSDLQQRKSLAKQLGFGDTDLSSESMLEIYKQEMASQRALNKQRDFVKEYAQKDMRDKANKEIEKADDYKSTLGTLSEMKRLSKDFSGPQSSITGRTYGTKAYDSASQFEALSNTALKPLFDLYNPRGPIPQRKIEMLRDLLKPNWNDTQPVIDAKIAAMEGLILHKAKRGDKMRSLLANPSYEIDPEKFYADDEEINVIDEAYNVLKKAGIKNSEFDSLLRAEKSEEKPEGQPAKNSKKEPKKKDELDDILDT